MKKILTSFILALLAFSSLFAFNATAQEAEEDSIEVPDSYNPERGVNLTLSPVFLSLATDPGEEVTTSFRVVNNNDFAEYLQISLVRIQANQDGTSPVIADVDPSDEFVSWTDYSPSEFVLNPNEEQTVRVTISPPEDAALGYYYGFVVGRMGSTEEVEGGTAVSASAAISLLLNVDSPNAKREVQIVDFTTDKLFYEYLPAQLNVKVKNTGNVHLVPFGEIFIDSLLNKDVSTIPVNQGLGNVLPGIEREFTMTWEEGFPRRIAKEENGEVVRDDNGNIVYETEYDLSNANLFRFGRYTANLILVYDNGERDVPIEATVSFWVIPWKIMGAGLVVVLLVLLGLRSLILPIFSKARRK